MKSLVREGKYRVVEIDNDNAIIVDTDGSGTELSRSIRVSSFHQDTFNTVNCAALLAMCLNADVDIISLHEALIADAEDTFAESVA